MSIRDDLTLSVLLSVAGNLLYRLFVHPWLEPLLRAVRAACVGLYRRLRSRDVTVPLSGSGLSMSIGTGALTASVSPPDLPPGTASAIAMAMQDPPPRPRFVNSNDSTWMLQEYARRQQGSLPLGLVNSSIVMQAQAARHSHSTMPVHFMTN